MPQFKIVSDFKPAGDQPQAIKELSSGMSSGLRDQVLLGVTGSGKTFTMANVIEQLQKPTMIMAHNKTLAAQLYEEMKSFFPYNAIEYFVSYFDYYQPEAYIPQTDTFIEKDSAINEQIDLLRHSATRSLIERHDVIVIASVSCIYGLGSPKLYTEMTLPIKQNMKIGISDLANKLVELQYERKDHDFKRGSFRINGDIVDIFPAHYENYAWRLSFLDEELESIQEFDAFTGKKLRELKTITVFANSHFVTPRNTVLRAADKIKEELHERVKHLQDIGKLVEAQRLEQRTIFDIEMMRETGTCKGIENYSHYLYNRNLGEPPPTLFEYLPKDALLFIDESHVTTPQVRGMYNADRARKANLVDYGFRLPSAMDNRPLKFEEWDNMRPQTMYISATPGKYELELTGGSFIEQVIRPTGLIDPECIVRPVTSQVDDLVGECKKMIKENKRVLVTTLTKRMAEQLADYMQDLNIKVTYLHSDIDTLTRIEIITNLRKGTFDVLIGVNLLREGLDIPECGLVAILDADKEGFLRSTTSLIQTMGRAARNVEGQVILYADKMTNSLKNALDETQRRRDKQIAHNKKHNITPQTIKKKIENSLEKDSRANKYNKNNKKYNKTDIRKLRKEMQEATEQLEFERAAELRDIIYKLEN